MYNIQSLLNAFYKYEDKIVREYGPNAAITAIQIHPEVYKAVAASPEALYAVQLSRSGIGTYLHDARFITEPRVHPWNFIHDTGKEPNSARVIEDRRNDMAMNRLSDILLDEPIVHKCVRLYRNGDLTETEMFVTMVEELIKYKNHYLKELASLMSERTAGNPWPKN